MGDVLAPRAAGRLVSVADASERAVLPVGAAVSVGALLAANGGFFPVSWSWTTIACLWAAALALTLRDVARLRRLELVFLGGLAALTAWTFLSAAWTTDVTQTVWEGQRTAMLLAAAAAVLTLAPVRSAELLLGGALAGIVAIAGYALSTRLFPDRIGA